MTTANNSHAIEEALVRRIAEGKVRIKRELAKVIRGRDDVIEQLLIALLAGGHALITGAPGLAKTLLIQSTAQLFHLSFNRMQFTPDLMPADITGTEILAETPEGGRRLEFVKGRCSPISFWPTKSTARRRKPSLCCSKRCRNTKSPQRV